MPEEYIICVQVGLGVVGVRRGAYVEMLVKTPCHALTELLKEIKWNKLERRKHTAYQKG